MRKYLYINDELVKSFIAQINKGWINECVKTKTYNEIKKDELQIGSIVNGELSANVLFAKAKANGTVSASENNGLQSKNESSVTNEVVLHDYAIDIIIENLEQNKKIVKNITNFSIGDIVQLNNEMNTMDMAYLRKLFEESDFVKYIPQTPQTNSLINNADMSDLPQNQYISLIKTVECALPFKRSPIVENCIIACEDKYFRDNPEVVAFKYGGKPTVLGYVTNVIINKELVNNDLFIGLIDNVNKVMFKLINKDKLYIINPIAIFYN